MWGTNDQTIPRVGEFHKCTLQKSKNCISETFSQSWRDIHLKISPDQSIEWSSFYGGLIQTWDNLFACQILLVYHIAKFDKTYLHWGQTSYNRKIGKTISAINKLQVYMRLTLNCSVCIVIFACTHPCDTNSLTTMYLLQVKIHNWMVYFWNNFFFSFRHNRNFDSKVIYISFNRTVCW